MTEEERTVYNIAYHLRIPVYKLMQEMPYDEFKNWCTFFAENPPKRHSDYQTVMLMRMQGFKGDPSSVFESLRKRPTEGSVGETLKSSAMFKFMQGAVGGDKLEL